MKQIYTLMAMGALLLWTGCSNDDALLVQDADAETCTITFNISNSGAAQTRTSTRSDDDSSTSGDSSSSSTSSVFSDGTKAIVLKYGVYDIVSSTDDDGNTTTTYTLKTGVSATDGDEDVTWDDNLSTTVTIPLAKGNSYRIVFWAESEDSPYDLDFTTDTPTMTYNSNTTLLANSDNYDAFYGTYDTGTVSGSASVSVTLTRPFAQINFGADDLSNYLKVVGGTSIETQITATGVYNTLNLLDGSVSYTSSDSSDDDDDATDSDTNSGEVTFTYTTYPSGETFPYPSGDAETTTSGTTYTYLAMCYVLLGTDAVTSDITLAYNATATSSSTSGDSTDDSSEGTTDSSSSTATTVDSYTLTVPSVPLKRNYRTNIYGSLLTGTFDFTLTKDNSYTDSESVVVSSESALAQALTDDNVETVLLASDIDVTSDVTISGDKEIDLGDNTLTLSSASLLVGTGAASVTYSNGTIESTGNALFVSADKAEITLDDVKLNPGKYGISVQSGNDDVTITLKESSITTSSSYGLVTMAEGTTINLTDSEVTASLGIYAGSNAEDLKLDITGSEFNITSTNYGIYILADNAEVNMSDTKITGDSARGGGILDG